jgi:hypothetical protein
MAITQITSQVISSNVITTSAIANNALETRHYSTASITADKLAANTATASPIAVALNANIDLVQSNVVATQVNVNTVSSNAGSILSNLQAYAERANANINLVQSNVTAIINETTDLSIGTNIFTIDKDRRAFGFSNVATSLGVGQAAFGSPANVIITFNQTEGGNVIIGSSGFTTTPFRLDVRGTANTGTFTATSVSSEGVELRANDYATYLVALGGLTGSNTAITNLQTGLTGTNAKLQANTLIFLGAHSGANTNITNLVTGLQGANTNISSNDTDITNLVTGLQGANTNISSNDTDITNLVTGLQGANTNISSNDTDITNLVTGLTGSNSVIAAITDGSTAFTGAVTMNDDLTVQGNLTVAGSFANLAVQDSYTDDRLLFLANNFTGSPSLDVGLLLNRGNDGNVFIGYDESQGEVALLHNFDPATNTAISGSTAANLRLNTGYFDDGTADAPSITFDSDPNTGIWRAGAETISFTTSGTNRFNLSTASFASTQTGGIRLTYADGTAAAPAFNFSGDADTGMYRTGADGLGFSTGGTAALTIADNQDASFASNVDVADGQYIRVGDGGDLKIFHSGTSSTIQDSGTGNLYIAGQDIQITNPSVSEIMATFTVDGAVTLYYDNAVKLTTKADGVDITGELQSDSLDVDGNGDISGTLTLGSHLIMGDSDEIQLGASTDLKIYHDGTDSTVYNFTGDLHIRNTATDKDVAIASDDGSGGLANYFLADGSTTAALLYFGGSAKLTTKTDGVDITGELQSDSLDVDGNADISGTLTMGSHIYLGDSDNLYFGADSDLQIYHDGSHSHIREITGEIRIQTTGGGVNAIVVKQNAEVELMYAGSTKLATKSDGVDITGELQSDSLDVDGNGDIAGTLTISSGGLVVHDSNGSSTNSLDLDYNGSSGAGTINVDSNGGSTYLAIGTSNSGTLAERLRITNLGNLLVGTTSSGFNFDARGTSNVGVFTATSVAADTVESNGVELRANDYITYTQLNANLNAVSSNADAKVDKAGDSMTGALAMGTNKITGLGDPTTAQDAATKTYVDGLLGASIVPSYTVNTASGTSNVIAMSTSPGNINQIQVTLNGIMQSPYQASGDMAGDNDWVFNSGNNSIQYTVASLPSGLVTVISAWDTP